jgi:cytochrome c biogenesis protein CcdA/glutaredoxin
VKKFFLLFIIIIFSLLIKADFILAQDNKVDIYFFYSSICPFCHQEEDFLKEMEEKYSQVEIKKYEISQPENLQFYQQMGEQYQVPQQVLSIVNIPLTFIGEKYFLGYGGENTTGKEIENQIKSLVGGNSDACSPEKPIQRINFFGKEIKIPTTLSLVGMGSILGLANGINPCTISVLVMLLAYLLTIVSFRQAIRSGIIFCLSVFLFYFLLMLSVYKGLCFFRENLISYLNPLKTGLGVILLFMGFWMAKDFFFLKQGQKVSFAIPKFAHPIIKKFIVYATLPAVILLAFFSSLVELPCSFALPLSYATILAEKNISPYPYFLLYNFFFVLPLFIIVAIVGFGFSKAENVEEWREKFKKNARLISGILLLFLGLAFLLRIF